MFDEWKKETDIPIHMLLIIILYTSRKYIILAAHP